MLAFCARQLGSLVRGGAAALPATSTVLEFCSSLLRGAAAFRLESRASADWADPQELALSALQTITRILEFGTRGQRLPGLPAEAVRLGRWVGGSTFVRTHLCQGTTAVVFPLCCRPSGWH